MDQKIPDYVKKPYFVRAALCFAAVLGIIFVISICAIIGLPLDEIVLLFLFGFATMFTIEGVSCIKAHNRDTAEQIRDRIQRWKDKQLALKEK